MNARIEPPMTNAIGYGNAKRFAMTATTTTDVIKTKISDDSCTVACL